jgi:general secretion pathway protein I
MKRTSAGFTLIEVLLALAVIAIALTALLKATSQNTAFTNRIKDKTIGHFVAMQGVAAIQLGLVHLTANQESTQTTQMAVLKWYWRVIITPTSLKHMHRINITVSPKKEGPFTDPLIAYRYVK